MAVHNGDVDGDEREYHTVGVDAAELQQYAQVRTPDGEVVVYDQDDEDAWIQSARVIDLGSMA